MNPGKRGIYKYSAKVNREKAVQFLEAVGYKKSPEDPNLFVREERRPNNRKVIGMEYNVTINIENLLADPKKYREFVQRNKKYAKGYK